MKQMLLFILIIVPLSLIFGASSNVTPIGQWGTGMYNGAFIKGNYAYIAAGGSGLDIIDISNPSNPVVIGNQNLNSQAYGIHLNGNYAYAACSNGLHIIDVSIPTSPRAVGYYYPSIYDNVVSGPDVIFRWVIVDGNYAYVGIIFGKHNNFAVIILDITDPAQPRPIGDTIFGGEECDYWGVSPFQKNGNYLFFLGSPGHELEIFDVSIPSSPHLKNTIEGVSKFALSGNFAYILYKDLKILNIADPVNPREMGTLTIDDDVEQIFAAGNYVYLTCKKSESQWRLRVIDAANPDAPRFKGSCSFSAAPIELTASGGTALVTAREYGLFTFDVSNPAAPTPLKHHDFSWEPLDISVIGNRAYVTDESGELKVFDISIPTAPRIMGTYTASTYVNGLAASGNYAYLATYDNGLEIIDIRNSSQPKKVGSFCPYRDYNYSDECILRDVSCQGNYAYIIGNDGRLYILDLAEPELPRKVGCFDSHSYRNYIHGDYAFLSGGGDIRVVDISNPASPSYIIDLYGDSGRSGAVYVRDRCAYVACTQSGRGSLDIFDFSVPSTAMRIGSYYTNSKPKDICVKGNYAYMLTSSGLHVVDVSHPGTPILAGHFEALVSTGTVTVNDDYIYLVTGDGGKLWILEFNPGKTPVQLRVSQNSLSFAVDQAKNISPPQTFFIDTPGDNKLEWSLATLHFTYVSGHIYISEIDWIKCSQTCGTGSAAIEVSIDPAFVDRLIRNEHAYFDSGVIEISAPNAVDSGFEVWVTIYKDEPGINEKIVPFGEFDTPIENTTVSGSIPITGWALDNIGVVGVQIFREAGDSLVYIGDAVFVEGARPDVERRYPFALNNSRAGWGYMLLTNTLPGGDGPLTLHAVATDVEGNQVTLGTRTVIVNNVDAVKPFGAIDTPAPGESTSGSGYVNFGWALTPLPNTIPPDGSTIRVWIDGLMVGQPVYNQYRQDLAEKFPGFNNSSGAVGYFMLDTTGYTNGIHTIAWSVEDDAGNADGIGSRYFRIRNEWSGSSAEIAGPMAQEAWCRLKDYSELENVEIDMEPVSFTTGFDLNQAPGRAFASQKGITKIDIHELERVVIDLGAPTVSGYLLVGRTLRPLPVGSTLDTQRGIFHWLPGPGFVGRYHFIFLKKDRNQDPTQKQFAVVIKPGRF